MNIILSGFIDLAFKNKGIYIAKGLLALIFARGLPYVCKAPYTRVMV